MPKGIGYGKIKKAVKGLTKRALSRRKKYKPVKGLGKPSTFAEGLAVERRLALKAEARRAKAAAKTKTKTKKKPSGTVRTKATVSGLKESGLSKKAIARLRGEK